MVSRANPASRAPAFDGYRCGLKPIGVSPRSQQWTYFELRLTEVGSTTLLLGGRETRLPERRLAVFWAGMPHQVLAHEAREMWSLRLPLAWVLSRELPASFFNGLLEGRVFFEPDIDHFECDLYRLRLWSGTGPRDGPLLRLAVELEVEARLARLAVTLPAALPPLEQWCATTARRPGRGPGKALELASLVARRHTEPLAMKDLGEAAGLHPNYGMNLFRRELGTTLLEYLTQHRLAHALRLLVTSGRSLTEIARESGFGSARRFRVTFRATFKDAPAAFRRRLVQAGQASGRRRSPHHR